MSAGRDRRRSRQPADEIARFKTWLTQCGAEVLAPTNPYEVVRFRAEGETSVIYRNDKNRSWRCVGVAEQAYAAFLEQKPMRFGAATPKLRGDQLEPIDRAIRDRDGDRCFFCGGPFEPAGPNMRTREHLVARTAGGPNHVSNLFHAHQRCNLEADAMSAPEKLAIRERNLYGALLMRAASLIEGNDGSRPLVREIGAACDRLRVPFKVLCELDAEGFGAPGTTRIVPATGAEDQQQETES